MRVEDIKKEANEVFTERRNEKYSFWCFNIVVDINNYTVQHCPYLAQEMELNISKKVLSLFFEVSLQIQIEEIS